MCGSASALGIAYKKMFFIILIFILVGENHGEGARDAVEAWRDGTAAFNDEESLYCLARRLCRASLVDFGSARALLASGVMRR